MKYTKPSRGKVIAAFEMMRITHPRLEEVYEKFDDAREAGRLTPRSPKRYIEFFAPSHSGKSMAIRSYIENKVVPELVKRGVFPAGCDVTEAGEKQKVVLHVTLSPNASVKSMASDILRALGDPRAESGDGPVLLRRVYEFLSGTYIDPLTKKPVGRQTELVILDEIQHLSASTAERSDGKMEKSHKITSTVVTDTLKTMMIRGLVPMVFVGVPAAREHLSIDVQLTNREMDKVDYSPLRWSDEAEASIFLEYCHEAAELLTKFKLLPEKTDLLADDIPEKLWAASNGCIGIVSRILEQAVFQALKRNAEKVEYEDLELAVDTRAIPNNMCTYNPFTEGVRRAEVAKAA